MADEKTVRLRIETTSNAQGAKDAAAALAATRAETEKLGTASATTEGETKTLDQRIQDLKDHIVSLGNEYEQTGSKILLTQAGSDRAQITRIEKMKQDLEDARKRTEELANEGEKATNWFSRLASNVGGAFDGMSLNMPQFAMPGLVPALIGAAALASPAIGAMISGAVVGVGAVGGIAGGVLSSVKDPAVQSAFKTFEGNISSTFFAGGKAFVGPVIDSLHLLSTDFTALNLGDTFAKAAPYATEFAAGIGDFVHNLMPGFNDIMDKSGPTIAVLAKGLGDTGSALSSFMSTAADSRGVLEGLQFLFDAVNGTIRGVGDTVGWLSNQFDGMVRGGSQVTHLMNDWFGWIPLYGDLARGIAAFDDHLLGVNATAAQSAAINAAVSGTYDDVRTALGFATGAVNDYTVALQGANQTADDAISTNLKLGLATVAVAKGWDTLKQAIAKDGRQNTTAEQDAILQQINLLDQQRKDAIAASDGTVTSVSKIDEAYDAQINKLLALAKQAGETKQQLDELQGKYYIQIDAAFTQQAQAWSSQRKSDFPPAPHRATGGPVMAGRPYIVNEAASAETYFPSDGYVAPANLTPAAAPTTAGRPIVLDGGGLGQLVWEWICKQVDARGGSVQAFGIH